MWKLLRVQQSLLYGGEFDRQSKCQAVRYVKPGQAVGLHRTESGRWFLDGVIQCGHATCPLCGPKLARAAATGIGAAIEKHIGRGARIHVDEDAAAGDVDAGAELARGMGGAERGHDAWMLTPTIPHYDESPATTVKRLYAAWSLFLRSRGWRRFRRRWGIVGVVRCLDASHKTVGKPHPHFHVALFPTASWMPKERATGWVPSADLIPDAPALGGRFSKKDRADFLADLVGGLVPAWERACVDAGVVIRDVGAFRKRALQLQPCEDAAAYFTKWGLAEEVGAAALKSDTHLTLLQKCADGDDVAGAAFIAWRYAVDGRQWVTGLADTLDALGVTDTDVELYADEQRRKREKVLAEEGKLPEPRIPLALSIPATLYTAALKLGWDVVIDLVERGEAAGDDPQHTLIASLMSTNSETNRTANARDGCNPPRESDRAPPVARMQLS